MIDTVDNVHAGDVQARFSAAAGTYGAAAGLHRDVAQDLLQRLPEGVVPRRILEPGCGTGVLTRRLVQHFPGVQIDAFDISPAMINEARRQSEGLSTVSWRVDDFLDLAMPAGPCDALISSAALHWAPSLVSALQSLAPGLSGGALVHVALMLDGTLAELHESRRAVVPGKQALRAMPGFEAAADAFATMGWACLQTGQRRYVTVLRDAQTALQHVHRQGVTSGSLSRGSDPLTRGELRRLMQHYDTHYAVDGGVSLTSEVGFFSFRTPAR